MTVFVLFDPSEAAPSKSASPFLDPKWTCPCACSDLPRPDLWWSSKMGLIFCLAASEEPAGGWACVERAEWRECGSCDGCGACARCASCDGCGSCAACGSWCNSSRVNRCHASSRAARWPVAPLFFVTSSLCVSGGLSSSFPAGPEKCRIL